MATTADAIEPGSRAYRVAPTQRRGEALLLVGPAVLYLIAFSVYPLVTSLIRSFESYDPRTTSWTWIGLANYRQLFSDPEFWHTVEHPFVFTFGAVAIQVVLGTALALFFNQKLRGATLVRGILILPMLLTPIVVGLMWRALLNPEWGMLNWIANELGFHNVHWLSDPSTALRTLILVDCWQWTPFVFVIVYARLQALDQEVFEAGAVDGATWFQRTRYLTLPMLMPAIVFAAGFPGIDAFPAFDLVFRLENRGGRPPTTRPPCAAFS